MSEILPNDIWRMFTGDALYQNFEWLPIIESIWRILFGTLVTVAFALCFRTRPEEAAQPGSMPS